jgi:hypothetical protein
VTPAVVDRDSPDETADPPCTVHYVAFRDDRYWSAFRVFGGARMIHRSLPQLGGMTRGGCGPRALSDQVASPDR